VRRLRASVFLCLFLPGCRAAPVNPATDGDRPPRRFLEPPAEFPAVFTAIRAVMALPDGHLVVSDPAETRVSLINFPTGTSRLLGRVGEGPREFKRAAGLYRGRGGGVLLFDHQLRRLLPILPSGALQDVIPLPTGGIAGSWSAHGPDDLTVDSLGHTYFASRFVHAAPTSPLLRYLPGAPPDTMTQLLMAVTKALNVQRNGLGDYQTVLFSPQDAWAVAPDGWIAVARAAPYRVEWIPPAGPAVTGPAIGHKAIRISKAEKQLIASGARGDRGRTSVSLVMVGPGGSGSNRASAPAPMSVKELRFAKVKTPVNLRDDRWPLLDESGRLWVERSLPFGVTVSVFDVFDRAGNLVDRIELPAGSRLVGFDLRWIYTSRIGADDFEHLQRFPLPH
jgi:hypothetical protein